MPWTPSAGRPNSLAIPCASKKAGSSIRPRPGGYWLMVLPLIGLLGYVGIGSGGYKTLTSSEKSRVCSSAILRAQAKYPLPSAVMRLGEIPQMDAATRSPTVMKTIATSPQPLAEQERRALAIKVWKSPAGGGARWNRSLHGERIAGTGVSPRPEGLSQGKARSQTMGRRTAGGTSAPPQAARCSAASGIRVVSGPGLL